MDDDLFDWIPDADRANWQAERPLNVPPDTIYRPKKKPRSVAAFYAKTAIAALLIAIVLGAVYGLGRSSPDALLSLLILATALVIYFMPSFVALSCNHANLAAVCVLNILLGWTFIGWVIALVWACMESQRRD